MLGHRRSQRSKLSASHRRVHPRCRRKFEGRGQRQMSQPERRERRRPPLPSNWVASHLVVTRPLKREEAWCSSGWMTMKLHRLLRRARRSLRAARMHRNIQEEARTSLSYRQGKSSSSKRVKFLHSSRQESSSNKQRQTQSVGRRKPRSNRRSRGRLWRRRDLLPRAWELTPQPRLGAWAGIVD